jgi:hypothetical protein
MRAQSDARAARALGMLAALVLVVLAVLVMTPFGSAFDGAAPVASNTQLRHPPWRQWGF